MMKLKACSIIAVAGAALASGTAVDAVKVNSPPASPEPRRHALRGGGSSSPVPQTELTRDTEGEVEVPSMPPMPMPAMPNFGGVSLPDGVSADEMGAGMRAMTKMMAKMSMRREAMRDQEFGSMEEAREAWRESDEDLVPDADQLALKALIEGGFREMDQMLAAGMSFEEIGEMSRREKAKHDTPEFQKWLGDVHAASLPGLAESLGVSEGDAHRHAMAGVGAFASLFPGGESGALSTTWGQAMHAAAKQHEIDE